MNFMHYARCTTAALTLCTAASADAWDGAKSGKITGIDVTSAENFAFRVYVDDKSMCGTVDNWAYMNKSWDNYDATASLLISAYLSGKVVVLYTTNVAGHCSIGYVSVRQ